MEIGMVGIERQRLVQMGVGLGGSRKEEVAGQIEDLAQKIHALIESKPLYYSEIAEQFSDYDFQSIARALGKLHADEKLWQDPRGRMCIRGSTFAAKPPARA